MGNNALSFSPITQKQFLSHLLVLCLWQTDLGCREHLVPLCHDGNSSGNLHCSYSQRSGSAQRLHSPSAHTQLLPLLPLHTCCISAEPPSQGELQFWVQRSQYSVVGAKWTPRRGIEPRSSAWQAEILSTILTRRSWEVEGLANSRESSYESTYSSFNYILNLH